jgi:PAS domain S-box-containing protein
MTKQVRDFLDGEELNRQLLDAVPGGVVAVSADGSIIRANAEAQRILGLCWDELSRQFVGDCCARMILENGLSCPISDHPITKCLQTGLPQGPVTLGVRRPDGQVSWAVSSAVPLRGPDNGRPVSAVLTLIDLNGHKRGEEEWRANETRLRLLVEQMPAVLWTTDRDLRFTSSTGAGLANLGLVPNQLRGVSLYEYFGTTDPEFLPIAATRAALTGESATYEINWQGRTFHAHIEPFYDAAGECVGTIGAALDITERKRAEEALRESSELHRIIAELTSDYAYVCRVDPNGEVILERVTDGFTRITGYTFKEIQALGGWIHLFATEDVPRMQEEVKELLTPGGRFVRETRIRTKAGEDCWIRYSSQSVWDAAQGRVVRLLGAVQNITADKRMEAKLRDNAEQLQHLSRRLLETQENERRHLARELHDEVGQNVTALKLSLETAARATAGNGGAGLADARALANGLIAQIRNLSLDLRPGMLDDLGLVPALVWHFQRFTAQTQVQVHFEHAGLEHRLPPALETAAYRIVQEGLTNVARHAGVAEATVRVWLDTFLGVQVEDHGAGFDVAAVLAARSSSGLVGMRERASLLGGQLAVESVPGAGTCLTAELPVPEAPEAHHAVDSRTGR